jgi:hypothetical protein
MLVHINYFFDLRLLDVLLLYYYCSQVLDKCKYYILCTFLYLARELAFWLVKITNRAGSLSSPNQARPSAVACWLKIKQISMTWVDPSVCLAKIMYIRIILDIKRYATYILPPGCLLAACTSPSPTWTFRLQNILHESEIVLSFPRKDTQVANSITDYQTYTQPSQGISLERLLVAASRHYLVLQVPGGKMHAKGTRSWVGGQANTIRFCSLVRPSLSNNL